MRYRKMKAKLREAHDEYSESGRLQATKMALHRLKAEVKAMDVLVGAKSAALLSKQLERRRASLRGNYRLLGFVEIECGGGLLAAVMSNMCAGAEYIER